MTYYLIPKTSFFIHKYIDCITSNEKPEICISNSLSCYLYDIKQKLDKYSNDWDIYKKYTNPYEYIHTSLPVKKRSVSKYKPLSRSYFKMIEILNVFNIKFNSNKISSFHLAEGPGGFIEALANKRDNINDIYIGMTIIDNENDPNIPAWKKSEDFLIKHPNVFIETGIDKTGNILSLNNLDYCKDNYGSSMDFITADGGFDFSLDFNSQEISISKLLFAQIAYAVSMQKKGGCFVLKIFDCFMEHTLDLLYLLSSFYNKTYIFKPQTSRYANSEKYIICKDFLFSSNDSFYPYIYNTFDKILSLDSRKYIHRFLMVPISVFFISNMEEYNAIFGQQQIENIYYTLSIIENKQKIDKLDNLMKINIQKCIQWCIKNNIEYNNVLSNTNIFLTEETSIV